MIDLIDACQAGNDVSNECSDAENEESTTIESQHPPTQR